MKKIHRDYLGTWLTRPDYAITESIAKSGYFSWLTIDMEHSTISINQMENMIRIIQLSNVESYVRLSNNDPILIKRVLDAGANGIIVPMVNTVEDIKNALDACFYPPKGKRGVGLARAQNYGINFNGYIEKIEPKTKVIAQIEHINAVKNIDKIFSVEGIYGYFIGPYDLSASIGKPGAYNEKKIIESLEIVKKAGIKHGIKAGYHVIEPNFEEVLKKRKEGYDIIGVSLDMLFLLRGLDSALNSGEK